MKLHPDIVGGDGEKFKVMQAEFEKLWERLKNVHQNAKGETYTKTSDTTTETPQEFIEVLKQLGFKFAYKKKAWYYHKDKFRKKSHEELTMDDIRDMFGSQRYEQKKEEEKKLQAAI